MVRITDGFDMISAVYRGRKTINQKSITLLEFIYKMTFQQGMLSQLDVHIVWEVLVNPLV